MFLVSYSHEFAFLNKIKNRVNDSRTFTAICIKSNCVARENNFRKITDKYNKKKVLIKNTKGLQMIDETSDQEKDTSSGTTLDDYLNNFNTNVVGRQKSQSCRASAVTLNDSLCQRHWEVQNRPYLLVFLRQGKQPIDDGFPFSKSTHRVMMNFNTQSERRDQ